MFIDAETALRSKNTKKVNVNSVFSVSFAW